MSRGLGSAVDLVHLLLSQSIRSGGVVVDATAGNGRDTLFLARRVGSQGRVYAFDIQEVALQKTSELLKKYGAEEQVVFIHASHEKLAKILPGQVDAVVFNLGYLPGGDHSLITTAEKTVTALESALELLKPGGRIGIVLYTGHPGGMEEYQNVEKLVSNLDPSLYSVIRITFLNRSVQAPVVVVIEKAGGLDESQKAAKNS